MKPLKLVAAAVAVGASLGGMTILTAHRIAPPRLWAGCHRAPVNVERSPRSQPHSGSL